MISPGRAAVQQSEPIAPAPEGPPTAPTYRFDVADYVAQMTAELGHLARRADLALLAYFLDMARVEAMAIRRRIESEP